MTDATLRLDAYLEGLLDERGGRPRPVALPEPTLSLSDPPLALSDPSLAPSDLPLPPEGLAAGLDPWELRAADQLTRVLVRFHPSFRFEEALAARLRAAAEAMLAGGHRAEGRLLDFPGPAGAGALESQQADDPELREGIRARDVLVGGAIASGLSLAGAAFVAWRRGHRVMP